MCRNCDRRPREGIGLPSVIHFLPELLEIGSQYTTTQGVNFQTEQCFSGYFALFLFCTARLDQRNAFVAWVPHIVAGLKALRQTGRQKAKKPSRLFQCRFSADSQLINTGHFPPSFLFSFSFFSSSYLPCLGGRDHEGGPPRVGPCIAQRGGITCPTAFGPLAGEFFGSFHIFDVFFSLTTPPSCVVLKKRTYIHIHYMEDKCLGDEVLVPDS